MRAIVIREPGEPDVLEMQDVEEPLCGPDEVIVAVHGTALNRLDLIQRRGRYPIPPGVRADIPGVEMSGIIESVGRRVTRWQPGDRVMALLNGEGYAAKVAVHERMLMPVPANVDLVHAAGIPEVFLTAYDALFTQSELTIGESVLIHSVGSGVGTAGVQLAAAQGCRVFGTAGSNEKLERAAELGLDVGVNYNETDFAEVVAERTGGAGVHVILDMVGAPYWHQNFKALAVKGRIIIVGTIGGSVVAELNLGALSGKRATVRGTQLRARALEEKATLVQDFIQRVIPLFANETIVPVTDRVFPLEEAAQAHRMMEANANFGKIVLQVAG